MRYFKIRYASPKRHEHWIRSEDGRTVELSTCVLTEPGARCVAVPLDRGKEIKGRMIQEVRRIPQYALRAIEYAEAFR